MRLAFFIGYRYLWGRSRMGAVNWVSGISSVAMAVVAMALVVVLSVYNGYVRLIEEGSEKVSPELLIRPSQGKLIDLEESSELVASLRTLGIHSYGLELRELGVVKGTNTEQVVEVVGLSPNYTDFVRLDTVLYQGDMPKASESDTIEALLGMAVALSDHFVVGEEQEGLSLYFPKKEGLINPLAVQSAFEFAPYRVVGILNAVREDVDAKVYIPLGDMQELLGYSGGVVSGIAISCPEGEDFGRFRTRLEEAIEGKYLLLDREGQHPSLSYLIKMERLMIYVIMVFILLLAGFNLMSSLAMMVMEKQTDLASLEAMGLAPYRQSLIFTFTGLLISLKGILPGILLGLLVVWAQGAWGLFRSGNSFASMPIPVEIVASDLVYILLLTIGVSALVAFSPRLFLKSK